jgi:hypothetical protein
MRANDRKIMASLNVIHICIFLTDVDILKVKFLCAYYSLFNSNNKLQHVHIYTYVQGAS